MYRPLGDGRLTSGERVELGVVEAPSPDWADRIAPFLHHKGPAYNHHIERALHAPLDDLDTRFYVGSVDDQLVTHAMVAGARGSGIFAHVYTAPSWRRRGAFGQLMTALMRDVRESSYDRLVLMTGFDTIPFQIYASHGFRPAVPGSGEMWWSRGEERDADYYQVGDATVRELRWGDWGAYNFVTVRPPAGVEPTPRSPAVGVDLRRNIEGTLLHLLRQVADEPRVRCRMLESATGAVVGWCHLVPSPLPLTGPLLLDLHVVPGFEDHLQGLVDAMDWPDDEPVLFVGTRVGEGYAAALAHAGFKETASLPSMARRDGELCDLSVWVKPLGC